MYIEETRHFLECLAKRCPTVNPVAEGVAVLRAALGAREASRTGRKIALRRAA
jgi:hypothetical protein